MLVEILADEVNLPVGLWITPFCSFDEIEVKVGRADLDCKSTVNSGSMFRAVVGVVPDELANFSFLSFGHWELFEEFEVEIFKPDGEERFSFVSEKPNEIRKGPRFSMHQISVEFGCYDLAECGAELGL